MELCRIFCQLTTPVKTGLKALFPDRRLSDHRFPECTPPRLKQLPRPVHRDIRFPNQFIEIPFPYILRPVHMYRRLKSDLNSKLMQILRKYTWTAYIG